MAGLATIHGSAVERIEAGYKDAKGFQMTQQQKQTIFHHFKWRAWGIGTRNRGKFSFNQGMAYVGA